MAVTQPSGVVHLVGGDVLGVHLLPPGSRCLQLPMVQTMKEHLGKVVHHLPLLVGIG